MDSTEPPAVVFEQPSPCADAAAVEETLRRALASSSAPRAGWTLRMRVSRAGATVAADGEISDDQEQAVAHRRFTEKPRGAATTCRSLARAIGVWAQLVFDVEVDKARQVDKEPAPASPATLPAPMADANVWPAPIAAEKPLEQASTFLKHEDGAHTIEVGSSGFFAGGYQGGGGIAGATLVLVIEVDSGWFLRPALGFGRSLRQVVGGSDVYSSLAVSRFDACKRVPGMYRERAGIQLDLCLGSDVGFVQFDTASGSDQGTVANSGKALPFIALGPSAGLRGELDSNLSVEVRGVGGWDFRELVARAEVGLTWRLR